MVVGPLGSATQPDVRDRVEVAGEPPLEALERAIACTWQLATGNGDGPVSLALCPLHARRCRATW